MAYKYTVECFIDNDDSCAYWYEYYDKRKDAIEGIKDNF